MTNQPILISANNNSGHMGLCSYIQMLQTQWALQLHTNSIIIICIFCIKYQYVLCVQLMVMGHKVVQDWSANFVVWFVANYYYYNTGICGIDGHMLKMILDDHDSNHSTIIIWEYMCRPQVSHIHTISAIATEPTSLFTLLPARHDCTATSDIIGTNSLVLYT